MTPCEKVAQFLALARSTPFVGERESAVRLRPRRGGHPPHGIAQGIGMAGQRLLLVPLGMTVPIVRAFAQLHRDLAQLQQNGRLGEEGLRRATQTGLGQERQGRRRAQQQLVGHARPLPGGLQRIQSPEHAKLAVRRH